MNAQSAVPDKLRFCFLGMCLAVLLLSFATAGVCQSGNTPKLEMKISLPKSVFTIGEPVLINCEFTNVSNEDIAFFPRLATEFDFIGFTIKRPDGTIYNFAPGVSAELNSDTTATPAVIPQGKTWNHVVNPIVGVIGKGKDSQLNFVMRTPGTYEITATYKNDIEFTKANIWRGKLTSNTVSLRVEAPTGDDAAAFSVWGSRDAWDYFADPGHSAGPKKIEAFKTLIQEYPNSVYALYANYYLAEAYQRINPHRFEDAIAQYRVALDLLPETHPLHAPADFNLGVCLCSTGKTTEGVDILKHFLSTQKTLSLQVVEARELIAAGKTQQTSNADSE